MKLLFLVGLVFELRALLLVGRYSTTLSHSQSFFALVIFQVGSCVVSPDCPGLRYFYLGPLE
jgi:hypothetical protein